MNAPGGEFAFIEWLRRQTPADPRVVLGPGDDAAAVQFTAGSLCLITTDMLMDGTCFRLAEAGPRAVGRKALGVNLSDLAAMAGRPVGAVVSLALPRQGAQVLAEGLFRGLREMADEYDTSIVGGDTNTWDGPLVISVTAFGEAIAPGPVRRSGARTGDWLLVTGPLGGSIRGRHLTFRPRVREALRLQALVSLHAMIDISDGLAADLGHVCAESRCGAVLRAEDIPIAAEAFSLGDGKTPLEHALTDGEDFELLLAVAPEDGRRLLETQPVEGVTLARVGECMDQGLWLEAAGRRQVLEPRGYVHTFA